MTRRGGIRPGEETPQERAPLRSQVAAYLHGPYGSKSNEIARAIMALDPSLSPDAYQGLKDKLEPPPKTADTARLKASRKRTRMSVVAHKSRFPNMGMVGARFALFPGKK